MIRIRISLLVVLHLLMVSYLSGAEWRWPPVYIEEFDYSDGPVFSVSNDVWVPLRTDAYQLYPEVVNGDLHVSAVIPPFLRMYIRGVVTGIISRSSWVPDHSSRGWATGAFIRTAGRIPYPGDHFALFIRVHDYPYERNFSRFGVAVGGGAPCSPPGDASDQAFLEFIDLHGKSYFQCFSLSEPVDWSSQSDYIITFEEEYFPLRWRGTVWKIIGDSAVLLGHDTADASRLYVSGLFVPDLEDSRISFGAGFVNQSVILRKIFTTVKK